MDEQDIELNRLRGEVERLGRALDVALAANRQHERRVQLAALPGVDVEAELADAAALTEPQWTAHLARLGRGGPQTAQPEPEKAAAGKGA